MNQLGQLHATKRVGHSGLTQTAEKAEILGRIVPQFMKFDCIALLTGP